MTEAEKVRSAGAPRGEGPIGPAVRRARARLRAVAGRKFLIRAAPVIAGAALFACAIRPLVWPLGDDAQGGVLGVLEGVLRGAAVGALVAIVAVVVARAIGRRRAPSMLHSARAIDEAAGTADVVASGFAFETDERDGVVTSLARARAERLLGAFDVRGSFPLPGLVPRRRLVFRFLPLALLALATAGFDSVVIGGFLDPPSRAETATADALAATAEIVREHLERQEERRRESERTERGESERSRSLEKVAERADRAASAARRADRSRALAELDALARDGERMRREERSLDRSLRELTESLRERSGASEPRPRPSPSRTSRSSSEELRLLARQLREERASARTPEEDRRMLDRLSRAEQALRRESERSGAGSEESERAADALREALDRLSRQEREAAAESLREASERVAELEAMRREASELGEALGELLERSGALERALARTMNGEPASQVQGEQRMAGGGEGEGDEAQLEAFRRALAERLAQMGGNTPSGRPGSALEEPHIPNAGGERRSGLEAQGDLHARSQVREGERATSAIAGLGANGEPTSEYEDVYPQYGAIAEEAMGDESVPVIRRDAVRRYFESIRPDRTEEP
jgi:hypothetical protein